MSLDSKQFIRFLIAGGLATVTYYVLAMLLAYLTTCSVMLVNTIAYGAGFIVSYTGQKYWTFQSRSSHRKTLPLFFAVAAGGFLLNSLIVWEAINFGLPYAVAALLAIAVVTVMSYIFQRYVVFK